MQFGFRMHHSWQFDAETLRQHFEGQQKREELIPCSDNVFRPESEVEAFESSVIKNLPMII